ncbi:(2Fe-2S)-binding protein [candidate division WOR-3 bacterium]|nr:(2Fe-2S)-binding protein [candidate division WOR-3 bacterium]
MRQAGSQATRLRPGLLPQTQARAGRGLPGLRRRASQKGNRVRGGEGRGTKSQRARRREGGRRSPVVVCRCEEVTEDQVRVVIRQGYHSLEAVKRILRTGMGHCQGRGCLRLIARLIQAETGIPAAEQKLPRPRPPLKPLPLGLLGIHASDGSDGLDESDQGT